MPSAKTECSELSVAFGILGIENPFHVSSDRIKSQFLDTLTARKYQRFQDEFKTKPRLYTRMLHIGRQLRNRYEHFNTVPSLKWSGPYRQATTTAAAKDLVVANIPVSIKTESNLVLNASPSNLFESIPKGTIAPQWSRNWYAQQDNNAYQKLYEIGRKVCDPSLPDLVEEFDKLADKWKKKQFARAIGKLRGQERAEFNKVYIPLCHSVAEKSADIFNKNFRQTVRGRYKNAILEFVARNFFRMDTIEYLLAGIDKNREFAVILPDLTHWLQQWHLVDVKAKPDLLRSQSVVSFQVDYENKQSGQMNTAQFHVEIRWSHGKFNGPPEAKLYKDFAWNDIHFFRTLF